MKRLIRFIDKLLGMDQIPAAVPETGKNPPPEPRKEPFLTETVVFGMHRYRTAGEDSSVYFVDELRGIRKQLVDSQGRFQNFPGIVKEDFWVKEVSPRNLQPQIRFRTSFEKRREGWLLLWQIQPDGRYWEDEDGFGGTNDEEIILYTHVDRNGCYTGPFRIYSIGLRSFTLDRFHSLMQRRLQKDLAAIRAGQVPEKWCVDLIPPLKDALNGWMSKYGAFQSVQEAREFLYDPELYPSVLEITRALVERGQVSDFLEGYTISWLHAGLTLFWKLTGEDIFRQALALFYEGIEHSVTVKILDHEE